MPAGSSDPPSMMVAMPCRAHVDAAREALVDAAQVDDELAVDEDEHVVVAVELQAERARVGEQVARLVGEPEVVEPALLPDVPLAVQFMPPGRRRSCRAGSSWAGTGTDRRGSSRRRRTPSVLYQYGHRLQSIASGPDHLRRHARARRRHRVSGKPCAGGSSGKKPPVTEFTWLENWYWPPPIGFISSVPTDVRAAAVHVLSVHHWPKRRGAVTIGAGPRYIGWPLAPSV